MKFFYKKIILAILLLQVKLFSFASSGVVLNSDHTLDYYEYGIYMKTINIPYKNYGKVYYSGMYYYLLENKENRYFIDKCDIISNKCISFNTPYGRSGVLKINLLDNGTGIITTLDGKVDYYIKNNYVKTIKISESWSYMTSFSGNAFYYMDDVFDYPRGAVYYTYRCKNIGSSCEMINSFYMGFPNTSLWDLSLDKNGNGFAVAYNGELEKFVNGKYVSSIWSFMNPLAKRIHYTGNEVYIFNEADNRYSTTSFIIKCDGNGSNCNWLRLNNAKPIDSSFR